MPTPVGKWTVSADEAYFVAFSIAESGGNRIVRRARPYRDGVKCDDTGSDATVWVIETEFENSLKEPGLPDSVVLYPDELNKMLRSCSIHETGDLQLSTRGTVRARLEHYEYVEDSSQLERARVRWTFVRDNEDKVDVELLSMASTRSTIQSTADATSFSLDSLGSFSDFVLQFEDACASLSELIAWPGEMVQDVDQKAAAVIRAVENIERQLIVSSEFVTDRLSDPESWAAWRQLTSAADLAARAANEKNSGIGKLVSIVTDSFCSIFDVAITYGQDPQQLMDINSAVEDFLVIPAGITLRIFQK